MRELSNIVVPKDCHAVFVHSARSHLLGLPMSLLRVLGRLSGPFLSGLVILFLMGFRRATMCVGGAVVQFGSPLVILVMRSVVIACGHL